MNINLTAATNDLNVLLIPFMLCLGSVYAVDGQLPVAHNGKLGDTKTVNVERTVYSIYNVQPNPYLNFISKVENKKLISHGLFAYIILFVSLFFNIFYAWV